MATILSIDAGLTSPGLAVLELAPGFPILHAECYIPDSDKRQFARQMDYNADRISKIVLRIHELAKQHRPSVVVAELPTGGARSANAIKGMAFSTAMTVAAIAVIQKELLPESRVVYVTPAQNKRTAGMASRSKSVAESEQSKWNVVAEVRSHWPNLVLPTKKKSGDLDGPKCWAVCDALATALTHIKETEALKSWLTH